jgi:hypothetical protein
MTNDVLEGCPGVHSVPISKNCSVFLPFDWQGERNRENPRGSQDMSSLHLLCYGMAGNNVQNERTNVPISFWKRISLVENRLIRFGPESSLLGHIEIISFDGADSETNSDVLVSFLLDVRMFVERLFLSVLTFLY